MFDQTVLDDARQMGGGAAHCKGRKVFVVGPKVAAVYRRAVELNGKLKLDDEIARFDAGGHLVDVAADDLADVCAAVVAADGGGEEPKPAEPAGKKGAKKDKKPAEAETVAEDPADEGKTADAT